MKNHSGDKVKKSNLKSNLAFAFEMAAVATGVHVAAKSLWLWVLAAESQEEKNGKFISMLTSCLHTYCQNQTYIQMYTTAKLKLCARHKPLQEQK